MGLLTLIGSAIGEMFSSAIGAIWERICPKKTVEEQKAQDLAHSATAALAVERKINEAAASSPSTLSEAEKVLREGKL